MLRTLENLLQVAKGQKSIFFVLKYKMRWPVGAPPQTLTALPQTPKLLKGRGLGAGREGVWLGRREREVETGGEGRGEEKKEGEERRGKRYSVPPPVAPIEGGRGAVAPPRFPK